MGREGSYRPRLTREEMERRRLAAARDLEGGMSQASVARKYGVNRSSVSRWAKAIEVRGRVGLRSTRARGIARLSSRQKDELLEVLLDGAHASGFDSDLWTGERVAVVIQRRFGVRYQPKYVPQLLREQLQMSYQKPHREARERNEAARAEWLRTTWTRVKKTR